MDRILKLIEKYKEEKQRTHKEYDKATKDIYRKYAFGRLQAYNRMIDDLSAVAEYPLREQANELLPDVSQQSELLLAYDTWIKEVGHKYKTLSTNQIIGIFLKSQ